MRELHVLIVEDDAHVSFIIEQAVASVCGEEGCFCVVTKDDTGASAHDLHKEHRFDLIIVDLVLPEGKSGMEVIRAIRGCDKTVEFIIITGHPSLETAVEAIALDVWAYFIKPFHMAELLAQARKAIEHSILKKKILSLARVAQKVLKSGD